MNARARFDDGMCAHRDERERLAGVQERRYEASERPLTDYETTMCALAMSDPVTVEALRVLTWRGFGAKSFIPKLWPLHMTAELAWRYANIMEGENVDTDTD
jgi:hypothetical protein